MTEAEWLTCADPSPMLSHGLSRMSDRKRRLFAVACCRRIEGSLEVIPRGSALEVAERFADGFATDSERSESRKAAQRSAQVRGTVQTPTAPKWERRAVSACYYAVARDAGEAAWNARQLVVESLTEKSGGYQSRNAPMVAAVEHAAQAILLRDIVGNPFRPTGVSPRWRTSNVVGLAQGIYDERAFDRLPILADALIDAGCDDEAILAHCRSGGPHVRGCWVVDLVLGRS